MFKRVAAVVIGGLVISLGLILYVVSQENRKGELGRLIQNFGGNSYTIDMPEYSPPPPPSDELFVDDDLAQKHTSFDPALVDSRLEGGWKINTSEAVLRLDVPMTLPDAEADLLQLSPSYLKAIANHKKNHGTGGPVILPPPST